MPTWLETEALIGLCLSSAGGSRVGRSAWLGFFGVENALAFPRVTLYHLRILEATAAEALGKGTSTILSAGGIICPNGSSTMDI